MFMVVYRFGEDDVRLGFGGTKKMAVQALMIGCNVKTRRPSGFFPGTEVLETVEVFVVHSSLDYVKSLYEDGKTESIEDILKEGL